MGRFLENVYDVLFQPGAAMRQIAGQRLYGQALAAFLLSVLIPAVAGYYPAKAAGIGKFYPMLVIIHLVGGLFFWFISSAVLHLIAEFYGGKGSGAGLFAATGFAHLPRVFIAPLLVIGMFLPAGAMAIVLGLGALGIMVWVLVLEVSAVKGAHDLSGAKAILVILTPLLTVLAALIAMITFIGTAFLPAWPG